MKRIRSVLVTGACGYLGNLLCRRLREAGYGVFGIHRCGIGCKNKNNGRSRNLDLSDSKQCEALLKRWKPEAVVHAAGLVHVERGEKGSHQNELFQNNVETTQSVLRAASRSGTRLFVFLSSMCVYGFPQKKKVDETHPLNPDSFYGTTKMIAEILVASYAGRGPMKAVTLRPAGFFGGERRDGLIYQWIKKALAGQPLEVPRGLSVPWSALSIEDVAEAILAVIQKPPESHYAVLNVGYPEPFHLPKLAREIVQLTGSRSPIRSIARGKAIPFAYDTRKIHRSLCWGPRPLRDRLKEYAELLREDNP